ncbi:MAG: hypothetical protein AAFY56_09115, partial [Pseudomonadota bacterium]
MRLRAIGRSLLCGIIGWIGVVIAAETIRPVAANDVYTFCGATYRLPGDIYGSLPAANIDLQQLKADRYSWDTFLALNASKVGATVNRWGDNKTQWQEWSSTVDTIQCQFDPANCLCPEGDCGQSGVRYYPEQCQQIPNHERYRVIGEIAKVDDLFLEAETGGLSNDPVIDSEGRFIRYEIMLSPTTQHFVVKNEYYDEAVLAALTEPVVFPCGDQGYRRGNPANRRSGAIVLKNAWMELGSRDARQYHTEELLIYTPAYRNSTGVASCERKAMALVGMHIARKTVKQPNWTWSTFEHQRNTPDCEGLPPAGDMAGSGPNTSCPTTVRYDHNFFPASCSEDQPGNGACQSCNAVPVSNASGCNNPDVADDTSWCLDLPPASELGFSKLCRQVSVAANHPTAHTLNLTCNGRLGPRSAWSNYQLISTQWYNTESDICQ